MSTPRPDQAIANGHDSSHAGSHAVPRGILLAVWIGLLALTAITVGVSRIDLGRFNVLIALFVAVIKGGLVVLFFMHLRWDSPFNAVILIVAIFIVALFIGLALLDTQYYQVNMQPPQSVQLAQ